MSQINGEAKKSDWRVPRMHLFPTVSWYEADMRYDREQERLERLRKKYEARRAIRRSLREPVR